MKRFKDILFVVASGKKSVAALERAVALVRNNQAGLTVVGVVPRVTAGIGMPDGGPISACLQAALVNEAQQRLDAMIEPFRPHLDIRVKILKGTPFLEIVREVLRGGHDLVIKSPEVPDWQDQLFGSDDMHLLRKCPCPIWLIKPGGDNPFRRILAAIDLEDNYPEDKREKRRALNHQILEMSGSLALAEFAELHVVDVWEAAGEAAMRGSLLSMPDEEIKAYVDQVRGQHEQALDALIEQTADDSISYLKPQTHLVKGWARKEIPALARRIGVDLIVMGTVGRTGIPGFIMGNTAEAILNQIDCSVLAIKPPGFVTPITLDEDG